MTACRSVAIERQAQAAQSEGRVVTHPGSMCIHFADLSNEVIAKLSPIHQNAAREGEERKRGVVTTPSLVGEAIAKRREGGWDESFAIASNCRRSYPGSSMERKHSAD